MSFTSDDSFSAGSVVFYAVRALASSGLYAGPLYNLSLAAVIGYQSINLSSVTTSLKGCTTSVDTILEDAVILFWVERLLPGCVFVANFTAEVNESLFTVLAP